LGIWSFVCKAESSEKRANHPQQSSCRRMTANANASARPRMTNQRLSVTHARTRTRNTPSAACWSKIPMRRALLPESASPPTNHSQPNTAVSHRPSAANARANAGEGGLVWASAAEFGRPRATVNRGEVGGGGWCGGGGGGVGARRGGNFRAGDVLVGSARVLASA
jgi:hypothetical protein